ncbi:MAG: SIR2 family NAD-dependent protein deacylase [Promethearchaeota archaeon]
MPEIQSSKFISSELVGRLNERKKQYDDYSRKIANLLIDSKYVVVITGAGISTKSGIPDFRSPKSGLWNRKETKFLKEPGMFATRAEDFWSVAYRLGKKIFKAKPNKAHHVIANWEVKKGIIESVITQNIDRLHQKAGSKNVIEIHGNAFEASCLFCKAFYSFKDLIRIYRRTRGKIPYCELCSGPIKPNVVFFGDVIPPDVLEIALSEIRKADLLLIIGSSLVVSPVNEFPLIVKNNGGKVIIINNSGTDLDSIADVVVHHPIIHALKNIERKLSVDHDRQ